MAAKKKNGRSADASEGAARANQRRTTGKGEGFDKINSPKENEAYLRSSNINPVDRAARMITQRYGNRYENEGSRTLTEYTKTFQDVVAESALTDSFTASTLDRAAAKVARQQWLGYMAGNEDKRKARRGR